MVQTKVGAIHNIITRYFCKLIYLVVIRLRIQSIEISKIKLYCYVMLWMIRCDL